MTTAVLTAFVLGGVVGALILAYVRGRKVETHPNEIFLRVEPKRSLISEKSAIPGRYTTYHGEEGVVVQSLYVPVGIVADHVLHLKDCSAHLIATFHLHFTKAEADRIYQEGTTKYLAEEKIGYAGWKFYDEERRNLKHLLATAITKRDSQRSSSQYSAVELSRLTAEIYSEVQAELARNTRRRHTMQGTDEYIDYRRSPLKIELAAV